AEFDHVGAGPRQAGKDRRRMPGIGIAGRDVGDEAGAILGLEAREAGRDAAHNSTPSALATVNTSLSPRPQRFITSRWSFGRVAACRDTKASAWAGSSAGRMPSSLAHSWKAASASRSV